MSEEASDSSLARSQAVASAKWKIPWRGPAHTLSSNDNLILPGSRCAENRKSPTAKDFVVLLSLNEITGGRTLGTSLKVLSRHPVSWMWSHASPTCPCAWASERSSPVSPSPGSTPRCQSCTASAWWSRGRLWALALPVQPCWPGGNLRRGAGAQLSPVHGRHTGPELSRCH